MIPIEIKIEPTSNMLREPSLHDGHLLGIRVPENGRAELEVTDRRGKRYRIDLSGVIEFYATDFREGNIILGITILRGQEVKLDSFEGLAGWYSPLDGNLRETLLQRVLRESLFVFLLDPSYGCTVIGIAKEIAVWAEAEGAGSAVSEGLQ